MPGKGFLPDALMLLFQDADCYVDTAAIEAESGHEESAADADEPVPGGPFRCRPLTCRRHVKTDPVASPET
jgi:hypothetical protein